ncbi:TPA: hypothetical protein QCJ76_001757 [Enterobacter asburiae]|nr:hypothetical protein [Enterobacter asburiae]
MTDSQNSEELIAIGHKFARSHNSDTPQRYDGLPENSSTLISRKELNDDGGDKCECLGSNNNVCDNKSRCAEGLEQGVLRDGCGDENQNTVIFVQLPKFSKNDMDVFRGGMLKALIVGESIAKKAIIIKMREYGVTIRFVR